MATITTRSGKGSALTHTEVDANFNNLNNDKFETSGGTISGATTVSGKLTATNVNPDIRVVAVGYFASDASTNRASGITASLSSTGVYAISFGTARPDANYIITAQIIEPSVNKDDVKIHVEDGSQSTSGFTLNVYEGDNSPSPDTHVDRAFYVVVFDVV
jgi:hypothetical protein